MVTVPPKTWGHYASAVYELAQRNGQRVFDRRGFEDSVALDGMRRLSEQAETWASMFPELTPRRLAEALVDGHPPRYLERVT